MAVNLTLESLGSTISALSATLSQQLRDGKHPEPSSSLDGPSSFPADAQISQSRSKLLDALLEMTHLVTGPKDYWAGIPVLMSEVMTFSVLQRFDFFSAIPLHGSASYQEISQTVRLPEQVVRRFIRVALGMQLFAIEPPDRVRHTALSAEVVRSPTLRPYLDFANTIAFPTQHLAADTLQRYFLGRSEPNDDLRACPFTLVREPDGTERGVTIWEYFEQKPDKAKLFAGTIEHVNSTGIINAHAVLDLFDWAGLGEDSTVVDVGGSSGHISLYLSQRYPNLKRCIVQDKPALEAAFKATVPAEIVGSGRIVFQVHDFFAPQEETGGDVYLLKSVLHDWPDGSAVEILRNLIPALTVRAGTGKKPARIMIVDGVMPNEYDLETGRPLVPLHVRRHLAGFDMGLFSLCNARDRAFDDWKALVKRADERLDVVRIASLPGSLLSALEVILDLSVG